MPQFLIGGKVEFFVTFQTFEPQSVAVGTHLAKGTFAGIAHGPFLF